MTAGRGVVRRRLPETPDRIWIAMRGELPLPKDAKPWTPCAALTPTRGNTTGNSDGLSATCETEAKRGWERRWEHSIFVVDGQGNLVQEWPHLEKLFSQQPCGRGPHQIKISPYDKEKHVWIIDDQLHMIYRFTYDGKLVHSKGQLGVRGRGPDTSIGPPISPGCRTGRTSSATATAAPASPCGA